LGCAAKAPTPIAETAPPRRKVFVETPEPPAPPAKDPWAGIRVAEDDDELPPFEFGSNPVVIDEPPRAPVPRSEIIAAPCRAKSGCYRLACLQKMANKLPRGTCVTTDGGGVVSIAVGIDPAISCGPNDPVCPCEEVLNVCR
jgi:hypothetical protein